MHDTKKKQRQDCRMMLLTAWISELERAEADVVEGFVVEHHTLIGILD